MMQRFFRQSHKPWGPNITLLLVTAVLLYLAYTVSGFFIPIGPEPVNIGGRYISAKAVIFARNLLVVILPPLMFLASGYLSGMVYGLNILRRWKTE